MGSPGNSSSIAAPTPAPEPRRIGFVTNAQRDPGELVPWRAFGDVDLSAAPGQIIALVGVEGSGARELLRSLAGLEPCTGTIEIAGGPASRRERLAAYVPATRLSSLYSNFSVGENLLVRLGKPEIAGFAMALRKKRMRQLAVEAVSRFLVKTRTVSQGCTLALRRQPTESGDRPGAQLRAAPAAVGGAELCGVDIRSKREIYRLLRDYVEKGNTAIMFCTEVPEVFEAADRVHVVSDGALSLAIAVRDYDQVEALATRIMRMERHSRDGDLASS